MSYRPYYLLVAGFALFVILILPLRGTLVDDTYIHLVYARNLAETGELSFNRGDPTYGATSPLWVGLLAAIHFLGGDLIVWCRVLSWAFALCSIALVFRVAYQIGGDATTALATGLVLSAEAWFLRWSAVGMETSFAAFMVLLAFSVAFETCTSKRRSVLFGILLFLATLARPEAVLLVPLSLAALPLVHRGRKRGCFVWLLVFIPLFVAWMILIKRHTGTFFPLTAGAKQGRPDFSAALLSRALVPAKILGSTLGLPCLAIVTGVLLGIRKGSPLSYFTGDERKGGGVLLMLLWIFGLPIMYVILDFQVLSRYLVPVIPAIVVLGLVSARRIATELFTGPRARRAALIAFAALVMAQNMVVYEIVVVPSTRGFSAGLRDVLAGMGTWLERNADRDAVVAAPDIGAIGYYSRRRVLDLGGLITPEINEMRQTIDVERIIEEGLYLRFEPDFLVDRSEQCDRFADRVIGGALFSPVMRGMVANLGIRKPSPTCYVLYRLERVE